MGIWFGLLPPHRSVAGVAVPATKDGPSVHAEHRGHEMTGWEHEMTEREHAMTERESMFDQDQVSERLVRSTSEYSWGGGSCACADSVQARGIELTWHTQQLSGYERHIPQLPPLLPQPLHICP